MPYITENKCKLLQLEVFFFNCTNYCIVVLAKKQTEDMTQGKVQTKFNITFSENVEGLKD